MYFKKCLLITLCTILLVGGIPGAAHGAESEFRRGTYYHEQFQEPISDVVPFEKLTHVVYAFVLPNRDGSLRELRYPEKLAQMVQLGHEAGVEVLLGVGGWGLDEEFETLAASEAGRKLFVDEMMKLVDQYGVDGVDLDWEYPDPGQSSLNYEALVLMLREALDARGKMLTAAVIGSVYVDKGMDGAVGVSDASLEAFDLVHIMTYDLKGDNGNSPMWYSWVSLQYWKNYRNVPQEKLILGVPFYARPNWRQYRNIISDDINKAYVDTEQQEGESEPSFYNGMNTMVEKTRLALSQAGGIFSWEINMDTQDEYSLTKVIHDTWLEYEAMGRQDFFSTPVIIYRDRRVSFDRELGYPYIDENSRTLVPVRKLSEVMGIDVKYDENTREATVVRDGAELRIPLNEKYIYVNGQQTALDTAAAVKDGRVYLPMRAFFEELGYTVSWTGSSTTIRVN